MAPDDFRKRILKFQRLLRIGNCRCNLGSISNDSFILHQLFDIFVAHAGHFGNFEVLESSSKVFSPAQNSDPRKPGLKALERNPFKHGVITG